MDKDNSQQTDPTVVRQAGLGLSGATGTSSLALSNAGLTKCALVVGGLSALYLAATMTYSAVSRYREKKSVSGPVPG